MRGAPASPALSRLLHSGAADASLASWNWAMAIVVSAAGMTDGGGRHIALLIGINEYEGGVPPLRDAVSDARSQPGTAYSATFLDGRRSGARPVRRVDCGSMCCVTVAPRSSAVARAGASGPWA